MKIVIITGLSGAGKTKAADWFEDQGYYCVDNIPPQLVQNFINLLSGQKKGIENVAFVTDIRSGEFFDTVERMIEELRNAEGIECKLLFMEASTETIIKRYNETRRNHPLTGGKANSRVIEDEKTLLTGIRKKADYVIDTTGMKGSDLEHELSRTILGHEGESSFSINITSFGYKYGIPSESDIVFDMRFIPNPYYVKSLKHLTGNNKKVQNFVFRHEVTQNFIREVTDLVNGLIPGYVSEGKYHLNIAFGCTGGHHRSVAVANKMAEIFRAEERHVSLVHRDLDFIARRGR